MYAEDHLVTRSTRWRHRKHYSRRGASQAKLTASLASLTDSDDDVMEDISTNNLMSNDVSNLLSDELEDIVSEIGDNDESDSDESDSDDGDNDGQLWLLENDGEQDEDENQAYDADDDFMDEQGEQQFDDTTSWERERLEALSSIICSPRLF